MIDSTGCIGNTIRTSSGVYFDLQNPKAADVRLLDIAYSLAKECRYTGHLGHNKKHYSVAEHCVRCVDYALNVLGVQDLPTLRAILLHDASEGYTGDINKPLKNLIRSHTDVLEKIEKQIDLAIAVRFNCDFVTNHDVIKRADRFMMFTEKRCFFGSSEKLWADEQGYKYIAGYDPTCMKPKAAAFAFLASAATLGAA